MDSAGQETDPGAFLRVVREEEPDFLVLGDELLGPQPLELLDACLQAAAGALPVIVYLFAPRQRLERLARRGSRLVRGPLSLGMLCRVLLELRTPREASPPAMRIEPPDPTRNGRVPVRLFDDVQLGRLREMATGVSCECPNHLAAIVSNLVAFERYCRECESLDSVDAPLHARLAHGTAEARVAMERLLTRLCEHDGIRP